MHQLGRKEFRHFARPYSPQVIPTLAASDSRGGFPDATVM